MNSTRTWCNRFACLSLNNVYKIGGCVTRNAATIADYKINWVRPEKIPCFKPSKTGDLGLKVDVKGSDIGLYYDLSKELETANQIVRKLCTVEFLGKKELENLKREKVIELVKRHRLDRGSSEVRIAAMTIEIHRLQEYIERMPHNKKVKVFLKELIDKRKKQLKHLRTWDYRRFEWILETLNLEYRPYPEKGGMVSRKDSMRFLTQKYCDNIIKQRLDAYKAELKAQQKDFFREKAEKLAFIRSEELKCGIKPTVTEEEIEETLKKVELLD